jgi:spore coat protein A, manganese oxidase
MLKSRRRFLALARAAGGMAVAGGFISRARRSAAAAGVGANGAGSAMTMPAAAATDIPVVSAAQRQMLNPMTLARFVDAMPVPTVIQSDGTRPSPANRRAKLPYYRVELSEFEARLHRDLPPTRQWGYNASVPGPTFETRSGQGLLVEWVNRLPKKHFLPVDHTLHGADADKPEVRTVAHVHGARTPPESDGYPEAWHIPGQSSLLHYPNEQEAAMLWYHDHAMGITRLNIFAGLFGAFIIRDAVEESLNLPSGACDIPIVIYDRTLDRDGQLLYPVSATPNAPFVSEFYGNAVLCNGKLYPYLEVQPRKYRFRLVNAANTRFFHLTLSGERAFQQIGTDVGLLPAPLQLRSLVLFPAERADLVIDFAGLEGQHLQLKNGTEEILQFRVTAEGGTTTLAASSAPAGVSTTAVPRASATGVGTGSDPVTDAAKERAIPTTLRPITRIQASEAVQERFLTLAEHDDASGNSMQMLLNETHWDMPVTEKPVLGTAEIWSFVNLSGDAHPIHLHLVRFQVLDRRPFDLFAYNGGKKLIYTGPAVPPDANELGWKDTVRADPGMVTRIIVRFEGYAGRYVWHCHTLEHEDNEMMRPYDVVAPGTVAKRK